MQTAQQVEIHSPKQESLKQEILTGLRKENKELPCKLFYDEYGSLLFDKICELEEYYPTRTETSIMKNNIDEIAKNFEDNLMMIEYGSGSSEKTRILLDHLTNLKAYLPIDISEEHLINTARILSKDYPNLDVLPVCADYTENIELPEYGERIDQKIVYFPGSTIGNFHPEEAVDFLTKISRLGNLLIGVDLKKDPKILNNAYNDSSGITAEFNLNQLVRINREFDANFNVEHFQHYAFYNEDKGRIEMHIVSQKDQIVEIGSEIVSFEEGQSIWTESSYKYSLDNFRDLAKKAGFEVVKVWKDEKDLFSVQYLTINK